MIRRLLPLFVAVVLPILAAADFSSDYEKGVEALRRGRAAAAVTFLQNAIRQRAQPGENIITYGTNRLPRYHPYLHLAEAHLQLKQYAEAQRALEASQRYGSEPSATREALQARVRQGLQVAAATPPPPTPVPTPVPTAVPATPEPQPAVVVATPAPPPTTVAPRVLPPPVTVPARPVVSPTVVAPMPEPSAAVESAADVVENGTLVIVSDPPAASVYLDDEPLGVTDPGSGRLFKSGVRPGRHRLRLARADHDDWSTEVEVKPGSLQTVRGALSLAPSRIPVGEIAATVVVLLVVVGGLLLARRRAPAPPAGSTGAQTVAETSLPGKATVVAPTAVLPNTPMTPGRTRRPAQAADAETAALGAHLPSGAEAFGPYVLLDQLGRGGMASVFRAQRNGETCALKRPLPGFVGEPEFLERFLREAEIGRTLHHPNIIRIFDRGDVDAVPYFTMELVKGETLHALLRRHGAFPPREATTIVAQVAEALDYAHLKGVVHRDLKPSNIMMLEDGTVKVMDYGIARARRFEGLTVTGAFLGTPEYVAPETAAGKGTDARSDLYALGVVYYELLTGKRPFSGETPFATIQKACTEPPTPPSLLTPGTPREVEAIVMKLLQKDPDARYPQAEELLIALREYLNRSAA